MGTDLIYNTDALSGLRMLDDNSVDCIVTSPPYWQLRNYGLAPMMLGGDRECAHALDEYHVCRKCGGWLGELGQEPTREMFIAHLIEIFDECRRVLKTTGTLWVNLGDSYCKMNKYNRAHGDWENGKNTFCLKEPKVDISALRVPHKSLCNIPGRFADEMILRGWIMRNEIIWYKPSVIPSPAADRFTVDFEKVFFFTKSTKYDFRQQFEPYAESTIPRYKSGHKNEGKSAVYRKQCGAPIGKLEINPNGRNKRTVWRVATENNREQHYATYPTKLIQTPIEAGCPVGGVVLDPFAGSGTTGIVARRLGRHYILIEPSADYMEIIRRRVEKEENPQLSK